jgi:hypothetical protein
LNTKFQSLAQALPNLINYRRPSKSQIVEKALDWVKQSISREERYRYQALQLQRENKRLLAQLIQQQQQQQETPTTTTTTAGAATASTSTASIPLPPSMRQHPMQMSSIPAMNASNNTNIPNMYSDLNTNNDWSINNTNQYMVPTPQMTPYSSTEDLTKQDFNSKSDDEDNVSSGNEDDIEYQSSPCNPSYLEHGSPRNQYETNHQYQHHHHHHTLMAAELYRK